MVEVQNAQMVRVDCICYFGGIRKYGLQWSLTLLCRLLTQSNIKTRSIYFNTLPGLGLLCLNHNIVFDWSTFATSGHFKTLKMRHCAMICILANPITMCSREFRSKLELEKCFNES